MNTDSVSTELVESTRKKGARIQSEILRRLADVTQERAADCIGVSASTVSRQKESLEGVCLLLAAIGLQLAPTDAVVIDQQELQGIERMALKYLQARVESESRRAME